MEIEINIDDETPLFTQFIDQIKKSVQSDALKAGDALPSIRQLANDLDLNNKTIAKNLPSPQPHPSNKSLDKLEVEMCQLHVDQ